MSDPRERFVTTDPGEFVFLGEDELLPGEDEQDDDEDGAQQFATLFATRKERQEGEEWETGGRLYRRVGGKTVRQSRGKERPAGHGPEGATKAARPGVREVHDAVTRAQASGHRVTREDVGRLADVIGSLTDAEVRDLRGRLGLTKGGGAGAKKEDRVKGIVDRLVGEAQPAPAAGPEPKAPAAPGPAAEAAPAAKFTPPLPAGARQVSEHDGLIIADVPDPSALAGKSRTTLIDPARAKAMGAKAADSVAAWVRDTLPLLDPLSVTAAEVADLVREKHEQATGERLSHGDAMHAVKAMEDAGLLQLHVMNETKQLPQKELDRGMWRDGSLRHFAMAPRKAQLAAEQGRGAGWADAGLAKLKGGE